MNTQPRIAYLKILFPIFLISAYSGIALRDMDFWDDFMPLRNTWLFLGWTLSTAFGGLRAQRTLKHKGYVNLLWIAFPIPIMSAIDLFLRVPFERPALLTILLMMGLSSLWLVWQSISR